MNITLYGIKSCDTCRKAIKALEATGKNPVFHDVRTDGLPSQKLAEWAEKVDWNLLLNTRSTTWRNLNDADKAPLTAKIALALIVEHPTLLKRPVIEVGSKVYVGWSKDTASEIAG
ncbi:MAG: Spx/MgsR family RNA polymerase-binding regulatory protein [Pseudomonadota bacterium]